MIREFNTRVRIDRRRRARLVTVAAVAVIAFVAASCGDSDSSADPIEDTTTTAAEQPEETLELDVEPDDTVEETASSQAQESEPEEDAGPEFIELSYYETQVGGGSPSFTNCQSGEDGLTECDFAGSGVINGTHVGQSTETITGTFRNTSEPCVRLDGSADFISEVIADGTISTQVGDEVYFRLRSPLCGVELLPALWTITGGTGRFQDASGTMSGRSGQDEEPNISVGTLRLRADLWDPILPPID